jgi:hypothetical protein
MVQVSPLVYTPVTGNRQELLHRWRNRSAWTICKRGSRLCLASRKGQAPRSEFIRTTPQYKPLPAPEAPRSVTQTAMKASDNNEQERRQSYLLKFLPN